MPAQGLSTCEENTMNEPVERTVEANDFLGKSITTGCIICYPVRRGSSMRLKQLNVLTVQDTPKGVCVSGTNANGRRIGIYNLSNCVIVES